MDLLDHRIFWAAHLWAVTNGPIARNDSDVIRVAFNMPSDAITEFWMQELANEGDWHYFSIVLPSEYAIEVEYCNLPEEHELTFNVCRKDWPSSICIGKGGGHFRLPGLRWKELLAISRASDLSAQAMLLLLPCMWLTSDDDLSEFRQSLIEACENLNLAPRSRIPSLVEGLLVASEREKLRWWFQEDIGWVTNDTYSYRCLDKNLSLTKQEFASLSAFFDGLS